MASTQITVHLWTERNPRAKVPLHVDFANLRSEPEATQAFTKRWGPIQTPAGDGEEALFLIRDMLRSDWRGERGTKESRRHLGPIIHAFSASIGVTAERIEIELGQVWQTAFLLCIRDRLRGKTAICENPECPAPYFLRKRKTQKFCEAGPCKNYGARQRRKKWRDAHGNEWRSARKQR